MTLTEFLLARVAEDEAEIGRWQAAMETDEIAGVGVPSWVVMSGGLKIPARVLAECDAKRRIVETDPCMYGMESDWDSGYDAGAAATYETTLRLLALPYADHPDYDPSWRP